MKKLIAFLILVVILEIAIFTNWDKVFSIYSEFFQEVIEKEKVAFDTKLEEIGEKVLTPGPLRSFQETPQSFLTKNGIVYWTNIHREENGLAPLSENEKLNAAADLKLQDMFEGQYFEHVSPAGIGITFFLEEADYAYIISGENLALGDFEDDENVVQSWMESPGHRKNILNERYQEIGVAAKREMFEGGETWLAVQVFGLPLSSCSQPDETLKTRIESYSVQLESLQVKIEALKTEIEGIYPKRGPTYNAKIREYNDYVNQYNNLVTKVKAMVLEYNAQVQVFNSCVEG